VSVNLAEERTMSKLPMESRPLRLAPEVAKRRREARSREAAHRQEAREGAGGRPEGLPVRPADDLEQWVVAYESAIITALGGSARRQREVPLAVAA
jgi:hypothetical protein